MTSHHLTDDEFVSLLVHSEAENSEAAHVLACALCREELERFRASIKSFNSLTLAWSERRSSTIPSYQGVTTMRKPIRPWSVAALMLLAIGASLQLHRRLVVAAPAPHEQSQDSQNSDEAIARDNELMRAVNLEINRKELLPLVADNVSTARQGNRKRPDVRSE